MALADWTPYYPSEPSWPEPLREALAKSRHSQELCPAFHSLTIPFRYFPPEETKVVLLGPDPYPSKAACGLAWGVAWDWEGPPPAGYRELLVEAQLDARGPLQQPFMPTLGHWAQQGVLLLNIRSSTIAGKSYAHAGLGWETLTAQLLERISTKQQAIVFLLCGIEARGYRRFISEQSHLVIETGLPGAVTGWAGSRPFSRANEFLRQNGRTEIRWG